MHVATCNLPTMLLKVGPVTNLQDARYAAALGAHYLSFSLEPGHPYKLGPELVSEMMQWLSGPRMVLECGAEAPAMAPKNPTEVQWGLEWPLAQAATAVSTGHPFGLRLTLNGRQELTPEHTDALQQAAYLALAADWNSPHRWLPQLKALARQKPQHLPLLLQIDWVEGFAVQEVLPWVQGLWYTARDSTAGYGALHYTGLEQLIQVLRLDLAPQD